MAQYGLHRTNTILPLITYKSKGARVENLGG